MNSKILTVSIAAYNVESYLATTLDSLIAEEVMDKLEVIIVNDGSKDETVEVAQKYVEHYPDTFILINKENGGWGSTINASCKVATGKYYKLLDGDDWFETGNLTEYIRILENADADMVFTQYTIYHEPEMTTELVAQNYPYECVLDTKDISYFSMHSIAIKTELLRESGFQISEHCFYTDVEFFLKCHERSTTFISYPISIYCYRLGREGQSVSPESMIKHADDHDHVIRESLEMVYRDEKFANIRPAIDEIALIHFNLLTIVKPTKENRGKFVSYGKLLKEKYPHILSTARWLERAVLAVPAIAYKPIAWLKRKHNNICG